MSLFLLFSVPLFGLFVMLLPWDSARASGKLPRLSFFFKGFLCFIPGYLLLLIVRAIVGYAATGFPLYLSLLFRDQMTPLLIGVGAFILVNKKLAFPATDEGTFLAVFSFLSGCYALFGIGDYLALYRNWDALDLFLTPLLRIALIVCVSLTAPRFSLRQGREAAGYLGIAAAMSLPAAIVSWLFRVNYWGPSAILCALGVTGSLVLFGRHFPRALGIGLPSPRKS